MLAASSHCDVCLCKGEYAPRHALRKLIRLRNSASAFAGELEILESADNCLELGWSHEGNTAQLSIDLQKSVADITIIENGEIARYHIADTLRAVTQ